MKQKVVIIDTNVMCVWLQIPGKETAGAENYITHDYVKTYYSREPPGENQVAFFVSAPRLNEKQHLRNSLKISGGKKMEYI